MPPLLLALLTDDSIYQEFLARSLTDKYSSLSTEMDKIISEANNEIMGLRDKLSGQQLTSVHPLVYR